MITIELQVLCEGQTESNFIVGLLGPHLREFGVFAKAIPLCKGNFGIVPFDKVRKAAQHSVGRLKKHQYITTMVDLYALSEFPGDDPNQTDAYKRVASIEEEMSKEFKNDHVLPYIQMHEFEAFVFVDLTTLESQFPDGGAGKAATLLQEEIGGRPPELINDGAQTAPSKRILRALPHYNKTVNGPAIAKVIGLKRLREACPHFDAWVSRLEALGS